MTFAELKADVFRRLRESSSSPVYWTEADVEAALNEGYMEISDATEWYERYRTIDFLAYQRYYDLRTVLRNFTVLSIRGAYNDQTSRWLRQVRVGDLDVRDARWERRTGEPECVVMRSQWWMGYWPCPAIDSGTVKQHFTTLPAELEDDDDEPGFHEVCHPALVEHALSDLLAQDGETTMALEAWGKYLAYEKALKDVVDGRASVPMIHGHSGVL